MRDSIEEFQLMRDIIDAFARFGEKTGGEVPYGFDVDADGRLTPNQSEQDALEAITDLRSRGWTLQAICDDMEARGVTTKTGYADEGVSSVAANRDGLQLALQMLCKGTDKDGDHSMPITKLTNDEVAVLQEMARQHLAHKTLMEAMEVTDADLARTSLTVRDNEGNKVIGRKVAKVAVNLRLDKPLIDIVDTQCKQMGMKKTDWIRVALWQFAERNNIATNAQQRIEGEATSGADRVYPDPRN